MNAHMIATVFGVGRLPFAPGTWASLVTLPFAALIMHVAGAAVLVGVSLLLVFLGVYASARFERDTGDTDPQACVIDEVAGQCLACAFAPLSIAGFFVAFLLFRFFDVTKLWPVSLGEKAPGGIGIMLDDMIAGFLAGIILVTIQVSGAI